MTGFSRDEEAKVGRDDAVPCKLGEELRKPGAKCGKAWMAFHAHIDEKEYRMVRGATAADRARQEQDGGSRRRNLVGACLAHLLHDGYTDQIYALLPVWQAEFGLSYAGLAAVRALYSGTMGGLQVPAERLAAGLSPRAALALATSIAAAG